MHDHKTEDRQLEDRQHEDWTAGEAALALQSSVGEQYDALAPGLLQRWERHQRWFDARAAASVDPYCRVTLGPMGPSVEAHSRTGRTYAGVNFASQDYLSLSRHPRIVAAAIEAMRQVGVHSAGSSALMGNTALSVELERRLAAFIGYADCTLFPTGWAAAYGAVKTLVRPDDYVVIDMLAHASLQEGARNATRNVFTTPHLSNEAIGRRLARIRGQSARAGILVVTETLFSMDSDRPDLAELIAICRRHGATLLVDVAHDLGALGATGRGVMEEQGVLGQVDVVMGSFSKSFASNGGFVACNHPALKLALRGSCGPLTFSNALSPVQAAIVLEALAIVDSPAGQERRGRLLDNVLCLRAGLQGAGFTVLGTPSAIVPTVLGDVALSRLATRFALEAGALVNLVEHPAVPRNGCRWRLQAMADHEPGHVERLVTAAVEARRLAREALRPGSGADLAPAVAPAAVA